MNRSQNVLDEVLELNMVHDKTYYNTVIGKTEFHKIICEHKSQLKAIYSDSCDAIDKNLLNPAKVPSVECGHTEPKTPNIISYEVPRLISYPNKIFIPKHKRKRGATYKVNDCFYDSDGDFLYRVIGM